MNTDSASSASPDDPFCGNSVSGLLRFALDATQPSPQGRTWQAPTPEHLAMLLPQYRISRLIGRGGMGAVYQGVQVSLNRPVAIKLLPAELAANAEFISRFEREAQTLAQLQHPGIVAVHDFGQTAEGHLYFIMEFVNGTDLQQIIHAAELTPKQALELTIQICEALHYAHSQGVIHRDIKPANVLVTKDGRAKLADFGLARPLGAANGSVTAASLVMGTPDYMAPEQWSGKVDHRADIYSLGVMLYEMLTGQRPQGAFDLPSQRVKVDARLDEVVIKAMRQEPNRRYQQVSELGREVDRIRTTEPPRPLSESEIAAGQMGKGGQPNAMPQRSGKGHESRPLRTLAAGVATLGLVSLLGLWAWPKIGSDQANEVSQAQEILREVRQRMAEEKRKASVIEEPTRENTAPATSEAPPAAGPTVAAAKAPEAAKMTAAVPLPAPASLPVQASLPRPLPAPAPVPVAVAAPAAPAVTDASAATGPAEPAAPAVIHVFSSEAQNALAWVLAPLEETVPPSIRQNLTSLREDLVDEGKGKPAASLDAYRAAYYLCEAMLNALNERENARVAAGYRAAQSVANQKASNEALDVRRNYMMSWPQHARESDQRAELQRQAAGNVALAGEAQKVAWAARAEKMRANLDALYRQFRAALR